MRQIVNFTEYNADALRKLCRLGRLEEIIEEYVFKCRSPTEGALQGNAEPVKDRSKAKGSSDKNGSFPNMAGFCRYVGIGPDRLDKILSEFPDEKEKLLATLEDEALNSSASPTVVTAYLKKRLGYEKESRPVNDMPRQLQIQFEHNIFEDGE